MLDSKIIGTLLLIVALVISASIDNINKANFMFIQLANFAGFMILIWSGKMILKEGD